MSFEVFFESNAKKFLEKSEKSLSKRILDKIDGLIQNPVPSNSKRILGNKELVFRIRIGDFRVLYRVNYKENKIIIIKIDKRERVYN